MTEVADLDAGAVGRPAGCPSATTRPRATVTQPSRSGGPAIGSTHGARRQVVTAAGSGFGGPLPAPGGGRALLGALAARRRRAGVVGGELVGDAVGVVLGLGDVERQPARHGALAEDRVAQHVVVHVAALGGEAGVLDVADDLDFVHAVAGAGGADDVLLDHHAAHVVGAEGQAQLPDLAALRHPRRLHVVEVVEDEPGDRQRAQVVDAGRLAAAAARCARADSSRR